MIESTELPNLVPQRIGDCFEIHILHYKLCDLLLSSQQNFLLEVWLRQCVSCKQPLLSWSSCKCRSFGPSGSEYKYCANPRPLFSATQELTHEKSSRVRPEEMYDFQKHIMFLQKWILSPQDLLQNRSLGTVPVCIVWQYYPHSNIVCIHKYDESMKSIDSGVCQKPWSILLWIVRAYLLTIEYQVVQFVPSISISEQFESIHVTILQQISFLLL